MENQELELLLQQLAAENKNVILCYETQYQAYMGQIIDNYGQVKTIQTNADLTILIRQMIKTLT